MSERFVPYFEQNIDSQEKEKALREIIQLIEARTFIFAQLFHGTGSAAISGILQEKAILSHQDLVARGQEVKTGEQRSFGHKHSTVSCSIHFGGALDHARIEAKDNGYVSVIGVSKQQLEALNEEKARRDELFVHTMHGGDSMNELGEVEVLTSIPLETITHIYLPRQHIRELKDQWRDTNEQVPICIDPTTASVALGLYRFFENPDQYPISQQLKKSPYLESIRKGKEYIAPQKYGITLAYPDAILEFHYASTHEKEWLVSRLRRMAIVLLDPSQAHDHIEPLWYRSFGVPRLKALVGEKAIPWVFQQLKECKNAQEAIQVILDASRNK